MTPEIDATHVGGCNDLCDGADHYLLPKWTAVAARQSAVAGAEMHTARARLATREALVDVLSTPGTTGGAS